MISNTLRPKLAGVYIENPAKFNVFSSYQSTKDKIVILSAKGDRTAHYFSEFCKSRLADYVWLTFEEILGFSGKEFSLFLEDSYDAQGIYYRDVEAKSSWEVTVAEMARSISIEHPRGICATKSSTNFSKPLHIYRLANQVSLKSVKVPPTQISNKYLDFSPDIILKSISNFRSIVVAGDDNRLNKPTKLTNICPVQMQKKIQGKCFRAHVIKNEVYSVSLDSSSIDYRYSKDLKVQSVSLPDEIKKWCIEATQVEGLTFSGVDLIKTADTWYCLEVNPNPGYHWFEENSSDPSYPISRTLLNFLQGQDQKRESNLFYSHNNL